MSTLAVSGASGFLGRHLCAELNARGHRIVELTRAALVSTELPRLLAKTEVVIHLAARAHVLRETSVDPRTEFWKSNVELTRALARAASSAGVCRFVFVSSAGVLGASSPPQGLTDESIPRPYDDYTASKLEAEACLHAELDRAMRLAILRPPLIFGADAKGNLMRLMRLARRGWPLPIGGLKAPRSMIGIRNLADLICVAATDPRLARSTFLAADTDTLSVCEVYRALARCAGHRPWLAPLPPATIRWVIGLFGRESDIARLTEPFVLRPTLAKSQLGWIPPFLLEDEIERAMPSVPDAPKNTIVKD